MVGGSVKIHGLDRIGRRMKKRLNKGKNVRWLLDDFHEHIEWRLNAMWTHRGKVRGPWGAGSSLWAWNAPSTVKGKGFNKPLFSSRGPYGSRIWRQGYTWSQWWQSRTDGARARFRLENEKPYVPYLEAGRHNMPPRWITGFIEGDMKWLANHATKNALKVN